MIIALILTFFFKTKVHKRTEKNINEFTENKMKTGTLLIEIAIIEIFNFFWFNFLHLIHQLEQIQR